MEVMGPRSLRKLFAREIVAAPMPEAGKPSQLGGWVLEGPDYEEVYAYYPKYRDLLQMIRVLYEKEEMRYPSSQGYRGAEMLWSAISEAMHQSLTLEDLLKKYKLPPPHYPLPIRRSV